MYFWVPPSFVKLLTTSLSDKQKRFCEEYIIDLNATQAYLRAGYKSKNENVANAAAARLLANVKVSAYVKELQAARSARTEISADYVLQGLKEVAERSLQRAPVMEWDYEAKAKVQARDDDGNGIWEFDSNGANRAFELLGKHLGIFEKDNKQQSTKITFEIV